MARKVRNIKKSVKKVFSIIVDGETEKWYFDLMKKHEKLRISVKPELPKKKKLKDLFETVKEQAKDYHHVIWILDFDTLIKESREAAKGKQTKIQELEKYKKQLSKYSNVSVLVNTPCLEIWYLLHFENTKAYYSTYEAVKSQLKKHSILNDYKKKEDFYKQNNDIYQKLKPYLEKAIERAEELGRFGFENVETSKAEIYKVFDILGIEIRKN